MNWHGAMPILPDIWLPKQANRCRHFNHGGTFEARSTRNSARPHSPPCSHLWLIQIIDMAVAFAAITTHDCGPSVAWQSPIQEHFPLVVSNGQKNRKLIVDISSRDRDWDRRPKVLWPACQCKYWPMRRKRSHDCVNPNVSKRPFDMLWHAGNEAVMRPFLDANRASYNDGQK